MKKLLTGLVWALISNPVFASAFQSFEYDGASVGNAAAGGAAEANSASTNFTNAAGLVRLKNPQIVISGDQVWTKNDFMGTSVNSNLFAGFGVPYTQSGNVSNRISTLLPAFHYGSPIQDRWAFGFSVTVPFYWDTEFPVEGVQRYSNTLTSIRTYNLSPSLAYQFTEKFSAGLGVDAMRMETQFNSVFNASGTAVFLGLPPNTGDTLNENKASGWGYGWHAGLLYQFTPNTRIGLNYRSQVSQKLSGTSSLIGVWAPNAISNQSTAFQVSGFKLPSTTTLSLYHAFNLQWAMMGSVNYTHWSSIQTITFSGLQPIFGSPITSDSFPQNFRNTWRYALGATYTLNTCWLFRAGIGYDQSPVTIPNLAIPDGNRTLLSIGTRYQAMKNVALDLGYTHAFIKNVSINDTALGVTLSGISKNAAQVVGLQLTWDII